MKKLVLAIFGMTAIGATAFAQKGNNQISPAVELAIPTGDAGEVNTLGYGVTVKGLYGVGEAGQISFTTGFLMSNGKKDFKELLGADKVTSNIIPLLAGYRHNFNGFFAEPQIGYAISSGKIKGGDYEMKDSQGAFTWAVGGGYVFNQFEAGVRYQSSHRDGGSSGFVGFRFAYNFSIGGIK